MTSLPDLPNLRLAASAPRFPPACPDTTPPHSPRQPKSPAAQAAPLSPFTRHPPLATPPLPLATRPLPLFTIHNSPSPPSAFCPVPAFCLLRSAFSVISPLFRRPTPSQRRLPQAPVAPPSPSRHASRPRSTMPRLAPSPKSRPEAPSTPLPPKNPPSRPPFHRVQSPFPRIPPPLCAFPPRFRPQKTSCTKRWRGAVPKKAILQNKPICSGAVAGPFGQLRRYAGGIGRFA